MRVKVKAPLTDTAMKRMLTKLDKLAKTDEHKIAILEQSVDNLLEMIVSFEATNTRNKSTKKRDTKREEEKRSTGETLQARVVIGKRTNR
jgi:hypothetical protein